MIGPRLGTPQAQAHLTDRSQVATAIESVLGTAKLWREATWRLNDYPGLDVQTLVVATIAVEAYCKGVLMFAGAALGVDSSKVETQHNVKQALGLFIATGRHAEEDLGPEFDAIFSGDVEVARAAVADLDWEAQKRSLLHGEDPVAEPLHPAMVLGILEEVAVRVARLWSRWGAALVGPDPTLAIRGLEDMVNEELEDEGAPGEPTGRLATAASTEGVESWRRW